MDTLTREILNRSSYGACVQDQFAPFWLDTDWLLGQFGAQRSRARRAFANQEKYADRNEAMAQAYRSGAYTMADIATFFDVHYMTVSRAVRTFEQKL